MPILYTLGGFVVLLCCYFLCCGVGYIISSFTGNNDKAPNFLVGFSGICIFAFVICISYIVGCLCFSPGSL
jgi:hypothetical protein